MAGWADFRSIDIGESEARHDDVLTAEADCDGKAYAVCCGSFLVCASAKRVLTISRKVNKRALDVNPQTHIDTLGRSAALVGARIRT